MVLYLLYNHWNSCHNKQLCISMLSRSNIPEKLNFQKGEVILLDKPLGATSFDMVKFTRENYPAYVKKIGHAGTLDPLATGLLILCTGKMTKKINHFQSLPKTYEGSFKIGATTPSYDKETAENETFNIKGLDEEIVKETAKTFEGEQDQAPPAYSAVKVKGERSFEKARRGEKTDLKSRKVQIHSFELTRFDWPEIHFKVECSKGTYIRSLVYDLAKKLNNGAYLTSLRRTAIGEYEVEDALEPSEIDELMNSLPIEKEDE